MITRILLALAFIFAAGAALADRPVTAGERAELDKALAVAGCKGGEMEFDTRDNKFEVDKTTCADGKLWEYDFDTSYKVIKKELED